MFILYFYYRSYNEYVGCHIAGEIVVLSYTFRDCEWIKYFTLWDFPTESFHTENLIINLQMNILEAWRILFIFWITILRTLLGIIHSFDVDKQVRSFILQSSMPFLWHTPLCSTQITWIHLKWKYYHIYRISCIPLSCTSLWNISYLNVLRVTPHSSGIFRLFCS